MRAKENINKLEQVEIALTKKADKFVRKGLTDSGANAAVLFLLILCLFSSLFLIWILIDRPQIPLAVQSIYFTFSFFASAIVMRFIPYHFLKLPGKLQQAISVTLWPVLIVFPLSVACYEYSTGNNPIGMLFVVLPIMLGIISIAERLLPFEENWRYFQHDFKTDMLFEAIPKAFVRVISPLLLYLLAFWGLSLAGKGAETTELNGMGVLFNQLPFWLQVVLFILVQDFIAYWAHRIAHETSLIWKFHSTHHYVLNLTWFNYNRHPLIPVTNILTGIVAGTILLIFRPSIELIGFVTLTLCATGPMLHSNIKINTKGLELVFATPAMHRWHHSPDPKISNNNYGFYVSIWDRLFGTFYLPNDEGPRVIGNGMSDYPSTFIAQAMYPFVKIKEHFAKTQS